MSPPPLLRKKMSDHLCYLRDSSEYIHGTVATPPPDLCGTWKVPASSPDNVSDGRDSNMVSGFRDTLRSGSNRWPSGEPRKAGPGGAAQGQGRRRQRGVMNVDGSLQLEMY